MNWRDGPDANSFMCHRDACVVRRGRKPVSESRAAEIRARLIAWRQIPETNRVSLRALAVQIGTSHQLLSFYLQRLDRWQAREYRRKAKEIRSVGEAENRLLTQCEDAQANSYEKAAFHASIDFVLEATGKKMLKQIQTDVSAHRTLSKS